MRAPSADPLPPRAALLLSRVPSLDEAPDGRYDGGWVPRAAHTAATGAVPRGRRGRHRRAGSVRLLTLPPALAAAATRPTVRAVWGFAALALAVAGVFGFRAWRAAATAVPAAAVSTSQPSSSGQAPSELVSRTVGGQRDPAGGAVRDSPGPSSTGPPSGASVVVHVAGQVRRPGVLRLSAGARVTDAVAQSGGATPAADLGGVNLARVLVDGEQVLVPAKGEHVTSGAAGPPGPGRPTGGSLVDLNRADAAALEGLPGVGPVLADRILRWRAEHGRFSAVEELSEIPGIGDKLLAELTPRVRV